MVRRKKKKKKRVLFLIYSINLNHFLVLLDDVGGIRLCDFGFGNLFDANKLLDTYCGSPFYAAPEMVTATPYRGPPVDMWSCGVILYAMLTGQLPFHCDTMPELFKKISLGLYREPSTLSEEALSLIRCLLCRNPKRRITAEGVLKHAWLEDRRSSFKKLIKIPTTVSMTFKMPKSSSPSTFDLVALPSPVVSVGDEELASYNNLQPNQKASKATQFLLHAIHRKSQVAPSKEKPKDTSKKGGKALGIVADRIKRLFSNSLVHKRLMPT
jgi:serine/threonine protein kinase